MLFIYHYHYYYYIIFETILKFHSKSVLSRPEFKELTSIKSDYLKILFIFCSYS